MAGPDLARATTATIRRRLIIIPARVATPDHVAPTETLALGERLDGLFDSISDPLVALAV